MASISSTMRRARALFTRQRARPHASRAHVSEQGVFNVVGVRDAALGARNAIVDEVGNVFVADPQGAHLVRFSATRDAFPSQRSPRSR